MRKLHREVPGLGNQPGTASTRVHLGESFLCLCPGQPPVRTVHVPFCSWNLLSLHSWVSLPFSTCSPRLERDWNVLAVDITKSLEQNKD